MAKQNILEVLLRTINDVQQKNKANPREQTADPTIFDLLRQKLGEIDEKSRVKRASRGKSPSSLLDKIRKEIEGVQRANKRDKSTPTAPPQIFDRIKRRLEERPQRQASSGLKRIVEEYNLDIGRLHPDIIRQIQQKYQADRTNLDKQYAQAIYDMIKQQRR